MVSAVGLVFGYQFGKNSTVRMASINIIVVITLSLSGFISGADIIIPKSPPEPWQTALMARYIMHSSDWVSIASISTQKDIIGYPFVSLKSLSDGPKTNSTGIPYLYMTDMDVSGHDLEVDSRVTIMATLAQSDYCRTQQYDPQDPRCAKVIITGKYIKVDKKTSEYTFGQTSLFDRHPAMKTWPTGHEFFVAKVDPVQIDVLDYFGGIKHVSKEDYFNANITVIINADVEFARVSVIEIIN
ncbi:protein CREG1 [Anoplophora glabripennis]|nr:protein CREG1 [Anoplophora glabripennis]